MPPSLALLTDAERAEVERVRAAFGGEVTAVRDLGHRRRENRQEAGMPVQSSAKILQGYVFDGYDVKGSLRRFRERLEKSA